MQVSFTVLLMHGNHVIGRLDGSSRFPKGNQWGFFPSVSAAWRMSEEPWMANVKDVMNNAKLRVSYGPLGNRLYILSRILTVSGIRNNRTTAQGHFVYFGPLSDQSKTDILVHSYFAWQFAMQSRFMGLH